MGLFTMPSRLER